MFRIEESIEQEIPKVNRLSLSAFNPPDGIDNPFHSEQKWKENYAKDGFIVTAYDEEKPIGFVFFYTNDLDPNAAHCWLAGVKEEYRRLGVFKQLMDYCVPILEKKGYSKITINTYKDKYPAMYEYLSNNGFSLIHEQPATWGDEITQKSFFEKIL